MKDRLLIFWGLVVILGLLVLLAMMGCKKSNDQVVSETIDPASKKWVWVCPEGTHFDECKDTCVKNKTPEACNE